MWSDILVRITRAENVPLFLKKFPISFPSSAIFPVKQIQQTLQMLGIETPVGTLPMFLSHFKKYSTSIYREYFVIPLSDVQYLLKVWIFFPYSCTSSAYWLASQGKNVTEKCVPSIRPETAWGNVFMKHWRRLLLIRSSQVNIYFYYRPHNSDTFMPWYRH